MQHHATPHVEMAYILSAAGYSPAKMRGRSHIISHSKFRKRARRKRHCDSVPCYFHQSSSVTKSTTAVTNNSNVEKEADHRQLQRLLLILIRRQRPLLLPKIILRNKLPLSMHIIRVRQHTITIIEILHYPRHSFLSSLQKTIAQPNAYNTSSNANDNMISPGIISASAPREDDPKLQTYPSDVDDIKSNATSGYNSGNYLNSRSLSPPSFTKSSFHRIIQIESSTMFPLLDFLYSSLIRYSAVLLCH